MIWGYLIHLGYNFWEDRQVPERLWRCASPRVRCDRLLWHEITTALSRAGANMLVIDLGEAVRYASHPELAARGAWSPVKLRAELKRLRTLGIEPIPKLNFSTTHDAWLGPYARMVSTPPYYRLCRDLIDEVVHLFDKPRFFHLGMDEETAAHQKDYRISIMRQHELWWEDLHFLVDRVEHRGSRAWVWADTLWHHRDEYLARMPHSVLQSNWYYGSVFRKHLTQVRTYLDLEAHGYDQVPTGSNWSDPRNLLKTTRYCETNISPRRFRGILQAPWHKTMPEYREHHLAAVTQLGEARMWLERHRTRSRRHEFPDSRPSL